MDYGIKPYLATHLTYPEFMEAKTVFEVDKIEEYTFRRLEFKQPYREGVADKMYPDYQTMVQYFDYPFIYDKTPVSGRIVGNRAIKKGVAEEDLWMTYFNDSYWEAYHTTGAVWNGVLWEAVDIPLLLLSTVWIVAINNWNIGFRPSSFRISYTGVPGPITVRMQNGTAQDKMLQFSLYDTLNQGKIELTNLQFYRNDTWETRFNNTYWTAGSGTTWTGTTWESPGDGGDESITLFANGTWVNDYYPDKVKATFTPSSISGGGGPSIRISDDQSEDWLYKGGTISSGDEFYVDYNEYNDIGVSTSAVSGDIVLLESAKFKEYGEITDFVAGYSGALGLKITNIEFYP